MSKFRWLTAEEQRAWRAYLEATHLLIDALDKQLQRDAGLSHADYEILVRLSEAERHRLRMSQLSNNTLFSRSRLSHAVARLEADGLVRREACPSDKRGTEAVLTDEGFAFLKKIAPGHVTAVREAIFEHLTPAQVAHLERAFSAIRAGIEGED